MIYDAVKSRDIIFKHPYMSSIYIFETKKLTTLDIKNSDCKISSTFCFLTMTKDGDMAEVNSLTANIGTKITIIFPASYH